MTAVDKSASDRANPTGEARAAKLIAWFNAGAGGKIVWGKPGDFDACVRIAGKHMRPDQAKGFCNLRHKDATGARPGKAPGERAMHKAAEPSLRLSLTEGPGLLVSYGDTKVQLDGGEAAEDVTKLSTASVGDDGGHFSAEGLSVNPRTVGDSWAYEITGHDRRVVWVPTAKAVPQWADGADLVFVRGDGVAVPPGFRGRVVPADDPGTTYLRRAPGIARSPARKGLAGALERYLAVRKARGVTFEQGGQPEPGMTTVINKTGVRLPIGAPSTMWDGGRLNATAAGGPLVGKALGMSTSAMVALYPPPDVARALALEGGELPEQLHVTLAYLGEDAVVRLDRDKIEGALAALAAVNGPISGEVGGLGRFNGGFPAGQESWPLVALMDLPTLPSFRQRLVGALNAVGVEVVSNHGFTPHLTLAYVEPGDEPAAAAILAEGINPTPLHFGSIVLAWGDDRTVFTLDGVPAAPAPAIKATAGPVIKADEAKRYTFAPLYPASPESPTAAHLDAHGDFATADDLQKAVWDYVRKGDFAVRDQHRDGTVIGEVVEIAPWPYEVIAPMTTADGTTVQKSFAPGTVFLGVVWNETGWSDVVKGRKTGYSLGGMATRVAVEMA